jgi:hypothetical protein
MKRRGPSSRFTLLLPLLALSLLAPCCVHSAARDWPSTATVAGKAERSLLQDKEESVYTNGDDDAAADEEGFGEKRAGSVNGRQAGGDEEAQDVADGGAAEANGKAHAGTKKNYDKPAIEMGLYKGNLVDPTLESAWFQTLSLKCEFLVSNVDFTSKLYRYIEVQIQVPEHEQRRDQPTRATDADASEDAADEIADAADALADAADAVADDVDAAADADDADDADAADDADVDTDQTVPEVQAWTSHGAALDDPVVPIPRPAAAAADDAADASNDAEAAGNATAEASDAATDDTEAAAAERTATATTDPASADPATAADPTAATAATEPATTNAATADAVPVPRPSAAAADDADDADAAGNEGVTSAVTTTTSSAGRRHH